MPEADTSAWVRIHPDGSAGARVLFPERAGSQLVLDNLSTLKEVLELDGASVRLLASLAQADRALSRRLLAERTGLSVANLGVTLKRLAARLESAGRIPGTIPEVRLRLELLTAGPISEGSMVPRTRARAHRLVCLHRRGEGWVLGLPVAYRRRGHVGQDLPCVGRQGEIEALTLLLQHHRTVTVVGERGIGKSTMVQAFCRGDRQEYGATFGGVWWVELTGMACLDAALERICEVLQVRRSGDVLADLLSTLRRRPPSLLVCDGVQDLPWGEAVAALREVSTLSVLATSRTPHRYPGERLFELGPMTLQDARCLAPAALDVVLNRGRPLELLHGGNGRTLMRTIDALHPEHAALLAAAQVFRGGFTLPAAIALMGDGAQQGLDALCDLQLINRVPSADRWPRYALPAEVAALAGPNDAYQARHAEVYGRWALRTEALQFAAVRLPFEQLLPEIANVRLALGRPSAQAWWSVLRLIEFRFLLHTTGDLAVLQRIADLGLRDATDPVCRGWWLLRRSWVEAQRPGGASTSASSRQEARAVFQSVGHDVGAAVALHDLIVIRGRIHGPIRDDGVQLDEALSESVRLELPRLQAAVLYEKASRTTGDERGVLLQQSAQISARFEDVHERIRAAIRGSRGQLEMGDRAGALERTAEGVSLALSQWPHDRWAAVNGLAALAATPLFALDFETARVLLKRADEGLEQLGLTRRRFVNRYNLALAELGCGAWEEAEAGLAELEVAWEHTRPDLLPRVRDFHGLAWWALGEPTRAHALWRLDLDVPLKGDDATIRTMVHGVLNGSIDWEGGDHQAVVVVAIGRRALGSNTPV